MKRYTVITTFNQQGLEKYGQRMISTFEQYWPDEVDLIVYTEKCIPHLTKPNVRTIDIIANRKHLNRFARRISMRYSALILPGRVRALV